MNLADLVALVGDKIDYKPGTTAYNNEVANLLNAVNQPFCALKPWRWAQKVVQIQAYGDVAVTLGAVTSSKNLSSVNAVFASWMVGNVVEIAGVEYEITQVDTTTSAWIDTAVTTSVGDTATVKHRNIDLPDDLIEVLGLGEHQHTSTQGNDGALGGLSRAESETFSLDPYITGVPLKWMDADAARLFAPARPGSLGTTAGTAWTAGSYSFKIGFKYGNRYSPMAATALTHTAVSTSAVYPTITLPNLGAGTGYKYVIYCLAPNYKAYRILEDDIAETGGTITLDTQPSARWGLVARASEAGGVTQRVRLWPRQSADMKLTLRYLARAPRLIEDHDTPTVPEPHQQVIVDLLLGDIYRKKGLSVEARLADERAGLTIRALEARYLTSLSRRWIKGPVSEMSGAGYVPRRTLTHL